MATDGAVLTPRALATTPVADAAHAILHCYYGVESLTHPYLAAELATAVNRWVADEWLSADDRFLASASIAPQFTDFAVAEIERVAADRRFVQLLLPARSKETYGTQRYWPIWRAAAEHDLVVGIAYGGAAGTPPTPMNWVGSYFEDYSLAMLNFETQLNSLVMSGVFAEYPGLRVTVLESGWTWLPGFLWRMDAEWKQYKRETPWLTEPPSAVVRRHFRFTTQPVDAPPDAAALRTVLDQIGGDDVDGSELLLYATDYPHRYARKATELLDLLTDEQADRVAWTNAREWYGLKQRVVASVSAS
jgi:predicted TIM-barrel fold metal-dependent hydrolase